MTEVYKLIHPVKFFCDYISKDIRPDGRAFNEPRNIKLNINPLISARTSALVKCGNTSVTCGIQLELSAPKAEEPDKGFLVTNVELPAICSSRYRPGPPSDNAQVVNKIVTDIIVNSKCVDLKDLCIAPDKLVWVVYCDIVCLDYGGSVVDACVISLMASLKALTLPKVTYDLETGNIEVHLETKTNLKLHGLPIATSFAMYKHNQRDIVFVDPTSYEEDLCGGHGANLILCYNNDSVCGVQKFGGIPLSEERGEEALNIAKKRAQLIEEVIDVCIKADAEKKKK